MGCREKEPAQSVGLKPAFDEQDAFRLALTMAHTTSEFLNNLRRQAGFLAMQAVKDGADGGLFIGPQMASKERGALARAGVTHLLSVNGTTPMIARMFRDFAVKVIDIEDAPGALCVCTLWDAAYSSQSYRPRPRRGGHPAALPRLSRLHRARARCGRCPCVLHSRHIAQCDSCHCPSDVEARLEREQSARGAARQ